MANWFTSLIAYFSEDQSDPEKPLQSDSNNRFATVEAGLCSNEPTKTSQNKLPVEVLKQFVPIRNLDETTIESLQLCTKSYKPGDVIFVRGQHTHAVFYLLKGTLEVSPDCKSVYRITAGSALSHLPLNSGRLLGATAIAQSDTDIIEISAGLIELWTAQSQKKATEVELIDIDLPAQVAGNGFFNDFIHLYHENKLMLPSLPAVAIKLKQAMQAEIDIHEAVNIIQIDSTIASKLVQVANSSLYSPISPVTNCQEAVTRLGLNATRQIVMSIGLKQMFQCQNKQLFKAMQSLWKSSLYVSSLSFILAQESGAVNPEDALLAGLISDIGIIPLLHFAEQHPERFEDLKDLDKAIPYFRAPVGKLVLHALGFPEDFVQIPHYAEDWYYDSGDKLTLADVVLLAKLHSRIGTPKAKELPYINSIPAYSKLVNGKLTPDFSLLILQKAQRRIDAAMQILS